VDCHGVKGLFDMWMGWTARQKLEQSSHFISCACAIMNNAVGFSAVIETPLAVRCLATCLDPSSDHVPQDSLIYAMELLAGISLVEKDDKARTSLSF
jgi:hypothetical protein